MSETTTPLSPSAFDLTEIPTDYRVPGTYVQIRPDYSQAGLFNYPARGLIIGQMLASGAGTAGQVYQLLSENQAGFLFGQGSIAHRQACSFLRANRGMPVDIVALADAGAAAKAAGPITVTRLPTSSGQVLVPIAGQLLVVDCNIATITTTTLLAAAIAAAVNAMLSLPVTATSALGVVTLTAKHGGLTGNDIAYQTPSWPSAGALNMLSIAGNAAAPAVTSLLTGGTSNPQIGPIFATIAGTWYTDIVMPWTDSANLAALSAELDRRYTAMVVQDAAGYVGAQATYASLPGLNSAVNGKCIAGLGGQNWLSPPWEVGASLAGVAAAALLADPARQLRGLTLPGIVPPAQIDVFTPDERNLLLHDGWSTFNVNPDNTVAIERLISMYLTTNFGFADTAWLDLNVSKVMSRIRYDFRAYVSSVWPRAKFAADGSVAAEYDPTIATPKRLKASWVARSTLYERNGWIEDSARLGDQAVFERDPNNKNNALAKIPVQIIGNLITLEVALNFQV